MKPGEVINAPASVRGFGVRHGQILLQVLFYIILFGTDMAFSTTLNALLSDSKFADQLSAREIATLIQSYLFGFLITALLSGFICKRYGFKWPMVIFMTIISGVTLNFASLTHEYGSNGLAACRFIQGLCFGLLFAMPAEVISRWVPVQERTVLGTAVYASGLLGVAISSFAGSILTKTQLNWSFIYTQFGYMAIIWVLLMVVFGADSPEQYSRKINESELEYIVQNRGNVSIKRKVKIPWRQMITSMPFWAIIVAQIGASWMLVVLTLYMSMFLHRNFRSDCDNITALIYLITWILSFAISGIAQLLIKEERTTIGQSRKLFNTLGTCIPAFFFVFMAFNLQMNPYLEMAIWVIISVCTVGTICGSKLNSNDITTNFAPIVYGTSTWISIIFTTIAVPLIAMRGLFDFPFVFGVTAALLILTNLFFLKFGSGEEQDWSIYEDEEDEHIDLSKSTSRTSVDEGKYLLYVRKQ